MVIIKKKGIKLTNISINIFTNFKIIDSTKEYLRSVRYFLLCSIPQKKKKKEINKSRPPKNKK